MAFFDKIKDIFQNIKNSISSLIKKLPFGKKKQLDTGVAQQPGAVTPSQQPVPGVVHTPPSGINQQAQTTAPPQQPSLQTNVPPTGSPAQPTPAGTPTKPEETKQIEPEAVKLLKYVRQYRQQGHTDEAILKFLMQHNWPEDVVKKALEFK